MSIGIDFINGFSVGFEKVRGQSVVIVDLGIVRLLFRSIEDEDEQD
jgi:uncharacterized protein YkvS